MPPRVTSNRTLARAPLLRTSTAVSLPENPQFCERAFQRAPQLKSVRQSSCLYTSPASVLLWSPHQISPGQHREKVRICFRPVCEAMPSRKLLLSLSSRVKRGICILSAQANCRFLASLGMTRFKLFLPPAISRCATADCDQSRLLRRLPASWSVTCIDPASLPRGVHLSRCDPPASGS